MDAKGWKGATDRASALHSLPVQHVYKKAQTLIKMKLRFVASTCFSESVSNKINLIQLSP